ncbi:papain-like cysteine protease family protein, partial [Nocardia brasiliensis]|uniref:papain-like cysteine protease family protein n=1 Tax=Nocardia brasiliensis TaxID=37326 RepID=UPI002456E8BF
CCAGTPSRGGNKVRRQTCRGPTTRGAPPSAETAPPRRRPANGRLFGAAGAPLSMTKVVDEISANRPILTGIAWAAGGGHAQVIYGFDVDAGTITYGDPWPSSRRSVTQAIDSYTQNADWVWFGEDYGIAAR